MKSAAWLRWCARLLGEFASSYTKREMMDVLNDLNVPCGPIMSIADIFADPHYAARGTIAHIEDPDLGEIAVPEVLLGRKNSR